MKPSDLKPGQRTDKCRTMRWKCNKHGCFESSLRCRLGKLDHLFPGNNGMTDVDAYCHLNGHKLFVEWKSRGGGVSGSQLDALKALSRGATVIVAWGDPLEMLPTAFDVYQEGNRVKSVSQHDAAERFDVFIRKWSAKAMNYEHAHHGGSLFLADVPEVPA